MVRSMFIQNEFVLAQIDGFPQTYYRLENLETGEVFTIENYTNAMLRPGGLVRVDTLAERVWCGKMEYDKEEVCVAKVELGHLGNFTCGRIAQFQGLIDPTLGETVIPVGKYSRIGDVYGGAAVVENWGEGQALISIQTGEILIPFGNYERIQLFQGGVFARMQINQRGERHWHFGSLSELLSEAG